VIGLTAPLIGGQFHVFAEQVYGRIEKGYGG